MEFRFGKALLVCAALSACDNTVTPPPDYFTLVTEASQLSEGDHDFQDRARRVISHWQKAKSKCALKGKIDDDEIRDAVREANQRMEKLIMQALKLKTKTSDKPDYPLQLRLADQLIKLNGWRVRCENGPLEDGIFLK